MASGALWAPTGALVRFGHQLVRWCAGALWAPTGALLKKNV